MMAGIMMAIAWLAFSLGALILDSDVGLIIGAACSQIWLAGHYFGSNRK